MPAPFRRSCSHCAKSKRRCNLARPRCFRCQVRSLECHYRTSESPSSPAVQTTPSSPQYVVFDSTIAISDTSEEILPNINSDVMDISLANFPDYDLDWADVMGNMNDYMVPDDLRPSYSPSTSVVAGDIYQERVVYLVKRLKSFPNTFVTTASSPFIHFNLFSESMPACIHDVLGICALYGLKNTDNEHLVFRSIAQKTMSLVQNFDTGKLSVLDQLASVQALILYQIIRLFDGDIRQRADAERADRILWEWTQQLKEHVSQMSVPSAQDDAVSSMELTNYAWRDWILGESLRRTILVSLLLQGLYSYLKHGWNKVHFEIKSLSFYGQRALWNARSEYAWKEALGEYSALYLHVGTWDADMQNAKPSDMDDLGVLMMTVTSGVDYTYTSTEAQQFRGNSGIGKQTVAVLASKGAKVYLGARSEDKYQTALEDIHASHPDTRFADIKFLKVDLSSAQGAKAAAVEFSKQEKTLHILYNNAGIMGTLKGKLSDDGLEFQWAVNIFGPFVYTHHLLPILLQTARSTPKGTVRIINTASNGAKQAPKSGIPLSNPAAWSSYSPFECYGISKIGVILWTRHLAKMYPSILSFAPHPGAVQSNLTRELSIPKPVMWVLNKTVFKPVQDGALTQLYAGTSPDLTEEENGSYLEPVGKIPPNLPHPQCSDDAFAERLWEWNVEAMRKALDK